MNWHESLSSSPVVPLLHGPGPADASHRAALQSSRWSRLASPYVSLWYRDKPVCLPCAGRAPGRSCNGRSRLACTVCINAEEVGRGPRAHTYITFDFT